MYLVRIDMLLQRPLCGTKNIMEGVCHLRKISIANIWSATYGYAGKAEHEPSVCQ